MVSIGIDLSKLVTLASLRDGLVRGIEWSRADKTQVSAARR